MCIRAALPSGHSPGFGSSEVPLQLLSQMKPPQQMSEFYKPGKRHDVLQAVFNLGKVTWRLHSWLWGKAVCVWTPAAAAPGEGRVLSADTARCCAGHSSQTRTASEQRAGDAVSGCRNLFHSFSPQLSFQHCLVLLRGRGMDPMNP